jgi:UPF0271 protein
MYSLMDINCDMGEGVGNEAALMPYINSANIACGYHAGNAETMRQVSLLCLEHQVHIGAHPSFLDRENFGRTPMHLPAAEVYEIVTAQLNDLHKILKENGAKLHHVKPHGALYNMAADNAVLANAIAMAVKHFDASLIFYGLSGSVMIEQAKKVGLQTANEVFADRSYQKDATLTPRTQPGALLQTVEEVMEQVMKLVKENKVRAITGEEIIIAADTICIHGDGKHAVEFAAAIYKKLHEK